MFGLLDPRIWLAALILSAVAFGGGFWKGHNHGVSMERSTWLTAQAEADKLARKVAADRQARTDMAMADAARREGRLRADARNAASVASGLRDTLDSVERAAATSNDAALHAVGALRVVVSQCTAEYLAVAEDADRSRSYAQTLMEGWPR